MYTFFFCLIFFFFFKQKTAYEITHSDWSSDVCSSDLRRLGLPLAVASAALVGLLLAASPAAAGGLAAAPTATTGPVSSVTATTATVTGTVNPNGSATTWFFEYGTSTGYGSRTSTHSAGSGTSGRDVSTSLT